MKTWSHPQIYRRVIFSIFVAFILLANPVLQAETIDPKIPAKTAPLQYTHVITEKTSYYLHGPQQAMPPQGSFKPGTKVILLQEMGSYTRVKSEDGIEAAVSTGSLQKIQ